MRRNLAPSGTPIRFRDLAHCITQIGHAPAETLSQQIRTELGIDQAFLFATGRGAMTFLLNCMRKENRDDARRYVVVPSYTCYSVVASVLKAGLQVLVCDVDAETLCLSNEQLDSIDYSQVLAVINTNLYGIPSDMRRLETVARDAGVYLVDDAAQSLGATFEGRPSGTFGDAGILSFDKGKVVTSINGGAIVTNNTALARQIDLEYANIASPTAGERGSDIVKLIAYFLMLRPWAYWIPNSLPFLGLGETRYDENFPVARYFDSLSPLVSAQINRIDEMNEHRRYCAAAYSASIPAAGHLHRIMPSKGSEPNYLRFPLRILDEDIRSQFLIENRTLGCSISYPRSIAEVSEISDRIEIHNGVFDGGKTIAAELVTLPTHAFVSAQDIQRISHGLTNRGGCRAREVH